jgi:UDP-N-acetylbacillosamine N-acetyltransferase
MVGFFREAIELAQQCGHEIIGCIDCRVDIIDATLPILGNDEALPDFIQKLEGALAFLTPDQPALRHRLYNYYTAHNFNFASLVSQQARISPTATVGEGAFIQWNAHLSSGVTIGRFVRVNVAANIMHDVNVGDFTTIAPNACILGGVSIDSHCYIGANATILPGVTVGEGSIIGAAAVVTRNVPPMSVVAGNPAKLLRYL